MTSGKTLIALSAAISLGLLGAVSVAQASNENDGGNETGGYVLPGNTVGVNPAYHPGWFGRTGNPLPWWWDSSEGGRGAFGYVPVPSHKHKHKAR
jgi:hypothetical protein